MAKPSKTEAKSAIWTPGKKLPDAVKAMARLLFIERYKSMLSSDANESWDSDCTYRACIATAQLILKIEDEEA